jgi:hypothetical protein
LSVSSSVSATLDVLHNVTKIAASGARGNCNDELAARLSNALDLLELLRVNFWVEKEL